MNYAVALLALFAAPFALADEAPLAKITVCPHNKEMVKSTTVTLTKNTITFDVVQGPLRIGMGVPAETSNTYPVTGLEQDWFICKDMFGIPQCLPHRGYQVKYTVKDTAGNQTFTLLVFSDFTYDMDNDVMSPENCSK
jgi:hypothetical protein